MWDLKRVVEGEVPSSDVASGANIRAVVHSSHPPSQCFLGNWDPSGFWRHCLDGVNSGRSEGVRAVQRWTTEDVLSTLPRYPLRIVSAEQLTWEPTMPLHPKSWSQLVADWCGETKCPLGGTDWCIQCSRAKLSHEISLKLLPVSYSASPAPRPFGPPSLLRVLPLKKSIEQEFLLTCASTTQPKPVGISILYTLCAFIITFKSDSSNAVVQGILHKSSCHFALSELCLLTIWPTYIKDRFTLWFLMSQLSNSNLHILRDGECCTQRHLLVQTKLVGGIISHNWTWTSWIPL